MSTLNLDASVADLVTRDPARARIFDGFGIDYCCNGRQSLRAACARLGLDPQGVLVALDAGRREPADAGQVDWSRAALRERVDHIEQTHHTYLRTELPRLTELVEKVVAVHGERHAELAECRAVFTALRAELEAHLAKEEQILFPFIREMEAARAACFPCGSLGSPIRVMEHEHESAGQALAALRGLTRAYAAPADACGSYRAMLAGLAALEGDLHRHVHKENYILFPRALQLEAERSAAPARA